MGNVKYDKIEFNDTIIIKRTFFNVITTDEVIDSFKFLLDNEYNEGKTHKVLITDIRYATLNFNFTKFRKVLSFIKKDPILSKMQLAVVVDSPIKTVFPTIAASIIGIHVKPFSTLDAAIKWAKSYS